MENRPSKTEKVKIDPEHQDYYDSLQEEDDRLKEEMGDEYDDFTEHVDDEEFEDDLDDEDDIELSENEEDEEVELIGTKEEIAMRTNKKVKKMKKTKKGKKDGKSLNGLETKPKFNPLDKLNKMETKNNVSNSLVKTLVDTVACLLIAPAISAVSGKFAPLVGGVINFSGHYAGDQSGLLRAVGMGTMVHGMAKVNEYRSEESTIKSRFEGIKDDWLKCFLNKESESKKMGLINSETKQLELPDNQNQISGVSSAEENKCDLSYLDFLELNRVSKQQNHFDENDTFENPSPSSTGSKSKLESQEEDDFDLDERLDFDDDIDFSRF